MAQADPATVAAETAPAERPTGPVVAVLRNGSVPAGVLPLAQAIASGSGQPLHILNAVRLARATPLTLPIDRYDSHRMTVIRQVQAVSASASSIAVEGIVRLGHYLPQIVAEFANDRAAGVVVLGASWRHPTQPTRFRVPLDSLRSQLDCPVLVADKVSVPDPISSLLVPIGKCDECDPQIALARQIAASTGAWIDLLHVTPTDQPRKREILTTAKRQLESYEQVDTWYLEADDVVEAIAEQADYYGITLIRGTQASRLRRFVTGSTSEAIRTAASGPIVTVAAPNR